MHGGSNLCHCHIADWFHKLTIGFINRPERVGNIFVTICHKSPLETQLLIQVGSFK